MTITISNDLVDRIVEPGSLVDSIRSVLTSDAVETIRSHLEYKGTWFGLMPAAGNGFISVKLVGVYPENPSRGMPLVRGKLLLFNASTGELVLVADAEAPTGWRTAAASALALEVMGFRGGGNLGVIGSGTQATYHLRVLTSLYNFDEIYVYSRNKERAANLASMYNGAYTRLQELLSKSDVIVAATNSREPVVRRGFVRMDSIIISVGAPKPVREIDDELVKRASCILVDTPMVLQESGDVRQGLVEESKVITLRDAISRNGKCIEKGVRLYKSVGTPILDLAMALYLWERVA